MNLYNSVVRFVEFWSRVAGLASVKTHSIYTRPLGPDSVVVDLGANVGEFTREMNRRFDCACYSVEAMPNLFAEIATNPKIHKFQLAIYDKAEPVTLYQSANRECNSLDQTVAALYDVQSVVECAGDTLEGFLKANRIEAVDLLKIDIEGAERQMFRSTGDATLRAIGQITIEFHDFITGSITTEEVEAICRRLKGLGFVRLPFSYLFPDMKTADFLFINANRLRIPLRDQLGFSLIRAALKLQDFKASLKAGRKTPDRQPEPVTTPGD